jgi:localization factor PodJL
LASLQDQVAAVRRRVSDMAPREAVAALEGSLGDLAQQVATMGREQRGEPLIAPLDKVVQDLREALSAYDPKIAAADFERRVESLGVRIDALADATVRPEMIDEVRRRMEEVHNLLLAAARRSIPIERLEGQITKLVDQVERLAANPSARLEAEQVTELLAALRRQAESATSPSVLASIESRLEDISGRLDHEVAALTQARPDIREFDGVARRIDAASQKSQFAAERIGASLDALNAKLEACGEPLAALIRDLNAKLVVAEIRDRERPPVESILSEIVEKLDRIPVPDMERETGALRSIDHELKSIRATVEGSAPPTLVRQSVDRLVEDVSRRLEDHLAGQATSAMISEQLAKLNGRFDALTGRLGEAGALESAQANADVAEQMSAFRQEQAAAERRTEALLRGIQDVVDGLIDRLPSDGANDERGSSVRAVDPSPLASFDHVAPRSSAVPRDQAAGLEQAASLREPEDEFLIEPGAGAPERFKAAADLAHGIGSRTNPAISAHIAAARRAAQLAVAESNDAKAPASWPRVKRNVQHAKTFYAQHRRSILLAAAVALAVTAVVRLIGAQAPFMQKSELDGPPKAAAARVLPQAASDVASAVGTPPGSIDTTPTASVGRKANIDSNPGGGSPPPELGAAIPSGATPSLREAILAGSPAAEYDLAQRLFEGRGLSQDQGAAAFWFERSASMGFAPAAFRLGALYQRGVGVQRDPTSAKRWYTAAAQSGNARAAHNLGVMDAEPVGEKADYVEAAKWFRRAAQMGVRDSQFNLAVLYARGLGVEQDLRQSWIWFSLAAAQGDAEAAKKRNEVAEKMDPDALAAAAAALSKFQVAEPDPAANDIAATSANWGDKAPPTPPTPTSPPSPRDRDTRSGS